LAYSIANLAPITRPWLPLAKPQAFPRVLLPQQYFEALGGSMGWRYWLDERQGYAAHASELHDSFAQLEDEPSRAFLAAILRYRLGQTRGIPAAPVSGPQYFPDFLTGLAHPPLGFVMRVPTNGDTLAEAQRYLPLREAWAFEPDPANFPRLAERARGLGVPVTCLPCGVSLGECQPGVFRRSRRSQHPGRRRQQPHPGAAPGRLPAQRPGGLPEA
jgi:hypothetical protein